MSAPPTATWRPPLLERPSHAVMARHGWLWLAVPGAVLLIGGLVIVGVLTPGPTKDPGLVVTLISLATVFGLGVLVIGLPVRAIVVRRHRRRWAATGPLPSLTGVYRGPPAPGSTPVGAAVDGPSGTFALPRPVHPVRSSVGLAVLGVSIVVVLLGAALVFGSMAIGGLYSGIGAQRLQHSSASVRITATLDRDTTVFHGRGASYTDHVSYTVAGHTEHGVEIMADRSQRTGDPIVILVEPSDPGDAIAASDHGYEGLILGGITSIVLVVMVAISITAGLRKRRAKGSAR